MDNTQLESSNKQPVAEAVPLETTPLQNVQAPKSHKLWLIILPIVAIIVLGTITGIILHAKRVNKSSITPTSSNKSQAVDLSGITPNSASFKITAGNKVVINGEVQAAQGLVLQPTDQPSAPNTGQIYVDSTTGLLRYFNGTKFVTVASQDDLAKLQTTVVSSTSSSVSVNSLQGATGDITLVGTNGLTVTSGGTSITLALPQDLSTSASPTFAGLTLSGGPLTVSNGGTGLASLTTNGVLFGNGTSAIGSVAASAGSQCLTSNVGNTALVFASCPGSNGVSVIGALDAVGEGPSAKGATIDTNTLYLQSATASFPGLVNTGAQTFAGNKTFSGNVTVATGNTFTADTLQAASGQNLTVTAGAGIVTLHAGGIDFTLPTTGSNSQIICTNNTVNCAQGNGVAVIFTPNDGNGHAQSELNPTGFPSIFINNTGGANLLQLQASGTNAFVVNSSGDLTLGQSTTHAGTIILQDGVGAGTTTLTAGPMPMTAGPNARPNPAANTLYVPSTESGKLCTSDTTSTSTNISDPNYDWCYSKFASASASNAYIQFAPATAQVDSTCVDPNTHLQIDPCSTSTIFVQKATTSGNIAEFQGVPSFGGTPSDVFSLQGNGDITFTTLQQSTTAFSIINGSNGASNPIFTINTQPLVPTCVYDFDGLSGNACGSNTVSVFGTFDQEQPPATPTTRSEYINNISDPVSYDHTAGTGNSMKITNGVNNVSGTHGVYIPKTLIAGQPYYVSFYGELDYNDATPGGPKMDAGYYRGAYPYAVPNNVVFGAGGINVCHEISIQKPLLKNGIYTSRWAHFTCQLNIVDPSSGNANGIVLKIASSLTNMNGFTWYMDDIAIQDGASLSTYQSLATLNAPLIVDPTNPYDHAFAVKSDEGDLLVADTNSYTVSISSYHSTDTFGSSSVIPGLMVSNNNGASALFQSSDASNNSATVIIQDTANQSSNLLSFTSSCSPSPTYCQGSELAGVNSSGQFFMRNGGNGAKGTLRVSTITHNITYNLIDPGTGTNFDICLSSGNCTSGAGAPTLQNAYTASTGSSTPEIIVDSTRGALDIQDANTTLGSNIQLFTVRGSNGGGTLGQLLFGVDTGGLLSIGNSSNANVATLSSAGLSANRAILLPDAAGTICLQTSASCGFIQNQNSGQQSSSNFWISGSGRADGGLLSPSLDVASTGTLSIGANNATAITVGKGGITTTNAGNFTVNGNTFLAPGTSQTAFVVQNAAGGNVIQVDTTATTNLVTNGGFEANTTGWSAFSNAGSAISRITSTAYMGYASLQVSTTSTSGGTYYPIVLTNGQQYTLNFRARAISSTPFSLSAGWYTGADPIGGTALGCGISAALSTTGWTSFSCTFTASSGTNGIFFQESIAGSNTFALDEVRLVTGSSQIFDNGIIALNGTITSPVKLRNSSDSNTAFDVLNAAGNRVLGVDTNAGQVLLGKASTLGGQLVFQNATNSFTATLLTPSGAGALAQNTTYNLINPNTASVDICLSSGNCTAGIGGGATIHLDNLSVVAINTPLLPASGASTIDLGSNAKPFRDLYVGGTATNNFRFTGTATAARTVTIPDSSGTICYQGDTAGCGFASGGGTSGAYIQNQTTGTQTANFTIQSAAANKVVATVQGAASQTSDLFDVKTSTPATVFSIDSNGKILAKNASDSGAAAFAIQNSSSVALFTANTSTMKVSIGTGTPTLGNGTTGALYVSDTAEFAGIIQVGDATNNATFNASHQLVYSGTSRIPKRIRLSAEYAGAVLNPGSGSNNNGTMTSGADTSSARMNYYNWTTSQATAQNYDIVTQVSIPSGFSAWASTTPLTASVWADDTTANNIQIKITDSANSSTSFTDITPGSTSTWTTKTPSSLFGGTFTAQDYLTITIRVTAPTGKNVRIGNIYLDYLSNN